MIGKYKHTQEKRYQERHNFSKCLQLRQNERKSSAAVILNCVFSATYWSVGPNLIRMGAVLKERVSSRLV